MEGEGGAGEEGVQGPRGSISQPAITHSQTATFATNLRRMPLFISRRESPDSPSLPLRGSGFFLFFFCFFLLWHVVQCVTGTPRSPVEPV